MDNIFTNVVFLLTTAGLLALVFIALLAVGHRRNKAFREATPEERAALFDREPHARDIVLLQDGTRVTLIEPLNDGDGFLTETVNDYGKHPEKRTIKRSDIVKIEYFS